MPRTSVKTPQWKKTRAGVAKGILQKAINQARGLGPVPRARQAMMLQAVRTGGWANPSSAETKFIDTTPLPVLTAAVNTFVATPILLNGCVQGTEATNRLGRKIVMKDLLLKGQLQLDPTTTGGGFIRIAVVYDKQSNGVAPAITDVFLTNALNSPNNLSNRDRFVKVVDMESPSISPNGDYSVPIVIYRKLNLETCFNTGNAGTIGDITTGSLYLFVCNNNGFATAAPLAGFQSRIKFTDH